MSNLSIKMNIELLRTYMNIIESRKLEKEKIEDSKKYEHNSKNNPQKGYQKKMTKNL